MSTFSEMWFDFNAIGIFSAKFVGLKYCIEFNLNESNVSYSLIWLSLWEEIMIDMDFLYLLHRFMVYTWLQILFVVFADLSLFTYAFSCIQLGWIQTKPLASWGWKECQAKGNHLQWFTIGSCCWHYHCFCPADSSSLRVLAPGRLWFRCLRNGNEELGGKSVMSCVEPYFIKGLNT